MPDLQKVLSFGLAELALKIVSKWQVQGDFGLTSIDLTICEILGYVRLLRHCGNMARPLLSTASSRTRLSKDSKNAIKTSKNRNT